MTRDGGSKGTDAQAECVDLRAETHRRTGSLRVRGTWPRALWDVSQLPWLKRLPGTARCEEQGNVQAGMRVAQEFGVMMIELGAISTD